MKFWSETWAGLYVRFAKRSLVERKILESKLENAALQIDHCNRIIDRLYEQNKELRTENRVLRGWSSKKLISETENYLRPD